MFIAIYIEEEKKKFILSFRKVTFLIIIGVPQTNVCKKSLFWSQSERMCVWPAQSDCKFDYYN
jgi:hypothetical protein